MNSYVVILTVTSPEGTVGTLTKSIDAVSTWEALQKAIDEVKGIGFAAIHCIEIV